MAKFLEVTSVDTPNNHLPNPLVVGEIVMEIQDEKYDGTKYVKVYHNEGKNISSFSRSTFKKYSAKDKIELIKLIKNKGRA
jgi:hypothetical protein